MNSKWIDIKAGDGGSFKGYLSLPPLGKGPGLEEFGRTIRYFVETPSVTGQMIALDGGQHMSWQTPDLVEVNE